MRLDRALIKNFRSIENLVFEFNPRCRVLVGINESGKSNILRALALLDPDAEVASDDLRETNPDEEPYEKAHVWFIFAIDAKDRARVVDSLKEQMVGDVTKPIIKIGVKELTLHEFVESRFESIYRVNLLNEKRTFSGWALSEDAKVIAPWSWRTRVTAAVPGRPAVTQSTVVQAGEEVIPFSVPGDKVTELTPEILNQWVLAEFNEILETEMPEVLLWKYSESHLLPGKIHTAQFAADTDTCLPLKHMFHLAGVQNIGEEIERAEQRSNGIRNLLKRVAKNATKHLHHVWKEYRGINFELIQNGEHIDAHVLDHYNAFDLSRRSDGFKRFVSFLLHISVKAKTKALQNTLYLDDEPDIGLHPSGARYLRDELVKVSKDNYVVYATHSIFMIDGGHLRRHLMVSKKNEVTTVEEASDSNFADEEVIFNALGYSIFEHLRESNLVFEGWRDKRLFEVALSSTHADSRSAREMLKRVGVCYAKGVKDIGRVTAMLDLARRRCVVLSDGDAPAREHQRMFKGSGRWLRYDEVNPACVAVTGEDFIQSAILTASLADMAGEDTRLRNLPSEEQFKGAGNLHAVKKWMKEQGLAEEEIKVRSERLKESLFTNLKPSHLSVAYYDLLVALAAVIAKEVSIE